MAKQENNSLVSSYRFKTFLVGGLAVASSAAIVLASQPRSATAGVQAETCETPVGNIKPVKVASYSRASLTSASVNGVRENELFWNSLSKTWLTEEQMELMQLAYSIGFADGGHEHAEHLQAVLLQETIAGHMGRIGHMTAPVGKRSYGVMQVKVTAARDVLIEHGELGSFRSDEELIASLLTDDEFNIRIASKFLLQLVSKTKTIEESMVAYNIGLRASKNIKRPNDFKYVVSTMRHLSEVVRPFNQRFADAGAGQQQVALR